MFPPPRRPYRQFIAVRLVSDRRFAHRARPVRHRFAVILDERERSVSGGVVDVKITLSLLVPSRR